MNLLRGFCMMAAFASICYGAGCDFPTSASCPSPDKHWELRCKSSVAKDGTSLNVLLLRATGTENEEEIYRFERSCNVLWSKDSRQIALTDWLGSNVSEIFIIGINPPLQATAISEIVGNMGPYLSKEKRAGHVYYEALEWLGANRLKMRVFGHLDTPPYSDFDHQFICDIDQKRLEPILSTK
jgi:hypothetical protein